MQILGLLGIYFDAVVVKAGLSRGQEEFTFIHIGSGHTVLGRLYKMLFMQLVKLFIWITQLPVKSEVYFLSASVSFVKYVFSAENNVWLDTT